jgi:hypothetical protein
MQLRASEPLSFQHPVVCYPSHLESRRIAPESGAQVRPLNEPHLGRDTTVRF